MLEGFARRRKSARGLAQRSEIVLEAAAGQTNTEIARRLRVGRPTVTRWRDRFAERRVDGLLDEPRPGRPRTITDEDVEAVVVKTLESTPSDATHWSTRSMAKQVGLTQNAVLRIWHAYGLQPHRQEKWKLSKDPLFVEKVHDVVGLYLNPPERAIVLCVDEKSQIQALVVRLSAIGRKGRPAAPVQRGRREAAVPAAQRRARTTLGGDRQGAFPVDGWETGH